MKKPRGKFDPQKKYNAKTYVTYALRLRRDDDADIIDMIEDEKTKGYSLREIIRRLIEGKK